MIRRRATLPLAVRRAIVAHARRDVPNECCGFLVGRGSRVMFSLPVANIDSKPRTGFTVDPAGHIAIRRLLRAFAPALQIVGVYHSHPAGPPAPSARDIADSHYPDWIYVIVGAKGSRVRAFRIRHQTVTPVPLSSGRASPRRRRAR